MSDGSETNTQSLADQAISERIRALIEAFYMLCEAEAHEWLRDPDSINAVIAQWDTEAETTQGPSVYMQRVLRGVVAALTTDPPVVDEDLAAGVRFMMKNGMTPTPPPTIQETWDSYVGATQTGSNNYDDESESK